METIVLTISQENLKHHFHGTNLHLKNVLLPSYNKFSVLAGLSARKYYIVSL